MEADSNESSQFASGRDTSHYSLTIEDAVLMFQEAGLPRTKRSIQKACKRGHLDCTLSDTDTGQRYFITEDSVRRRIDELNQIDQYEHEDAAGRGASRQDAERRGKARPDAAIRDSSENTETEETDSEKGGLQERIRDLELEVVNLKIDNKGKEMFINQMVQERQQLLTQVREGWREAVRISSQAGRLEARLALHEPRPETNGREPEANRESLFTDTGSVNAADEGKPEDADGVSPVYEQPQNDASDTRAESNDGESPNPSSQSNYQPGYPHRHDTSGEIQ